MLEEALGTSTVPANLPYSSCLSNSSRLNSYSNDFFANKVQSDDLRLLALLEMTAHGIADLLVKPREVIGLSKNRLSKGARCVSAFGRFFYHENQFGHGISSAAAG